MFFSHTIVEIHSNLHIDRKIHPSEKHVLNLPFLALLSSLNGQFERRQLRYCSVRALEISSVFCRNAWIIFDVYVSKCQFQLIKPQEMLLRNNGQLFFNKNRRRLWTVLLAALTFTLLLGFQLVGDQDVVDLSRYSHILEKKSTNVWIQYFNYFFISGKRMQNSTLKPVGWNNS